MILPDQEFLPFIIDGFGYINEAGLKLIDEISEMGAQNRNIPNHVLKNYWLKIY